MRKRLSLPYLGCVSIFVLVIVLIPLLINTKVRQVDSLQSVSYSREDFIEMVAPDIVKVAKSYGIKPSIVIAKAAIDSEYGETLLSQKYHNLYHIKATGREHSVSLKTSDEQDVVTYKVYKTWRSSIYDYFGKIKDGSVGRKKFYVYLISQKNYKDMASIMESYNGDGSKTYAKRLIEVVKAYQLTQYDK